MSLLIEKYAKNTSSFKNGFIVVNSPVFSASKSVVLFVLALNGGKNTQE